MSGKKYFFSRWRKKLNLINWHLKRQTRLIRHNYKKEIQAPTRMRKTTYFFRTAGKWFSSFYNNGRGDKHKLRVRGSVLFLSSQSDRLITHVKFVVSFSHALLHSHFSFFNANPFTKVIINHAHTTETNNYHMRECIQATSPSNCTISSFRPQNA